MICFCKFCAGEDEVAHGICDRCVCHIASLFLCRRWRSCPRLLSDRCELHHCLLWSVVSVQGRMKLPTETVKQLQLSHCLTWSVVSVQERTELPTASVGQMRLSHCLTWSVVSVQERTELPTAFVRQMRASSLPLMTWCLGWPLFYTRHRQQPTTTNENRSCNISSQWKEYALFL